MYHIITLVRGDRRRKEAHKQSPSKMIKDKLIKEEVVEYKVYKEKPYLNSDRDPLGVTINGKLRSIFMHMTLSRNLYLRESSILWIRGK